MKSIKKITTRAGDGAARKLKIKPAMVGMAIAGIAASFGAPVMQGNLVLTWDMAAFFQLVLKIG